MGAAERLQFSAAQCAEALSDFAGLPRASLEDATAAAKALGWMRRSMDFVDGLYLAKAEGCEAWSASTRISPKSPTPPRCGRRDTARAERT